MVDSDNSDSQVPARSQKEVKRREYGTPVDDTDVNSPGALHSSSIFFRDNSPSNGRDFPTKKRANRRKPRAKKVVNNYNEDHEQSIHVQNESLDSLDLLEVEAALNKISFNLSSKSNDKGNCSNNKDHKKPKEKQNKDKNKTEKAVKSERTPKSKTQPSVKYSKGSVNSQHEVGMNPEHKYVQNNSINSPSPRKNKNTPRTPGKTPNRKKDPSTSEPENIMFEDYMTKEEVDIGLEKGELISGYIRINPKDFKTSYISNPVKLEQDIIIESLIERNRSLEGDLVVVKLKKEEEWRSPTQKTGAVVHILQEHHPRTAVGVLKLLPDKNKQFACFHPRDCRIPRIKIPFTDWPALFYDNADKYEQVLFLAKIKQWPDSKYAFGSILENIGMSGDIKTETIAILKENCLDVEPYRDEMKQYFPSSGVIPDEEYKSRIDLRKECIFTIDPLTARDLDDAVSCKELPNGNLEIGVHISDVTYYLKENTPLNKIVSERATSTYMVESVYHMLPKELCMLCSLLPGEDKLAFSVFWEMTKEGKILSHKFSRTVINSCTQLAYEHAQMMLEDSKRVFKSNELPQIYNGYTQRDLSKVVNYLHKIALNLRQGRFDDGALRIDQPKLAFRIDPVTCLPLSYCIYENKECHRLIEEFMLLANITVATRLRQDYPKIAFLRSHPAPTDLLVLKLQKMLEKVGIHIDISSSGGLQKSLWCYNGDDVFSQARMLVLSCLCAKTMTRAHYFCADGCDKEEEYWHYALSIPLYTHFTSPIRRYADIMVHRLLSGSLQYTDKPAWNVDDVCEIAANCNKQKFNAKRAGEQSIELYLIHYIAQNQPVIEDAVIVEVRATSFDFIVLSSGYTCRFFLNKLPDKVKYQIIDEDGQEIMGRQPRNGRDGKEVDDSDRKDFSNDKKIRTLVLFWPNNDRTIPPIKQTIAIFTIVKVRLTKNDKRLKIDADLLNPNLTE